jgi:hypothetical protein
VEGYDLKLAGDLIAPFPLRPCGAPPPYDERGKSERGVYPVNGAHLFRRLHRQPHPEEPRPARRLEGWTAAIEHPTLRDRRAGLLRVTAGPCQHSATVGVVSKFHLISGGMSLKFPLPLPSPVGGVLPVQARNPSVRGR